MPTNSREYNRAYHARRSPEAKKRKLELQRFRVRAITAHVTTLKRRPCMDCGGTFPPVCMDFDHLPGNKKSGNVSTMARLGWSTEKILAEIAKCDLVCSNCHRIRTATRRSFGV